MLLLLSYVVGSFCICIFGFLPGFNFGLSLFFLDMLFVAFLILLLCFAYNNTGNQNGVCRDQEASRTSGSHCIPQICNCQLKNPSLGSSLILFDDFWEQVRALESPFDNYSVYVQFLGYLLSVTYHCVNQKKSFFSSRSTFFLSLHHHQQNKYHHC